MENRGIFLLGQAQERIALVVFSRILYLGLCFLIRAHSKSKASNSLPVMMVSCFLTGILGVTSYTIRISATQSYVPDEKKGRFNGAFNMLNTVGSFTGNLLAGALVAFLPVRGVLTGFMLVTAAAAIVVIGGGRRDVSAIYNRQE
mgnify:CR=1 FL=1